MVHLGVHLAVMHVAHRAVGNVEIVEDMERLEDGLLPPYRTERPIVKTRRRARTATAA